MPRKTNQTKENLTENENVFPLKANNQEAEIERLNNMLAAVLNYISDDSIEVIDLEYLFNTTEGLRDWWATYREKNRQKMEEEIKKSLGELSLEELEKLHDQVKAIEQANKNMISDGKPDEK